ncbi:hypothetical protein LJK87_43890 [Paenibacillus sp. P25]|nr:hypothetical protein LJK87_43890 [Paenibacillus sp. P25]
MMEMLPKKIKKGKKSMPKGKNRRMSEEQKMYKINFESALKNEMNR